MAEFTLPQGYLEAEKDHNVATLRARVAELEAEVERVNKEWFRVAEQYNRETSRLNAVRVRLREALQALYDEQNGPPLLKHKQSWEAAMAAARAALEGKDPDAAEAALTENKEK